MELATQTHLTTLRKLLTYRQRELRADIHAALPSSRDVDELALVDAALQRLDAGSYGDCSDCGKPIALQRLLAQPAAQRCAVCQAAREHALR